MENSFSNEAREAFEAIWNIPDDTFEVVIDTVEKGLKDIAQNPDIINRLRSDLLQNKMSIFEVKKMQNSFLALGQEYLNKVEPGSLKARYLMSLINTYVELFERVLKEGLAQTIPVDIELTSENSKIPVYAHLSDAGCDVFALEDTKIPAHSTVVVQTGFKLKIPDGFEVQVRPRSGMSTQTPIQVIFGTIDSGYCGEVGVMAYNRSNKPYTISKDTRIAQLVLAPSYRIFFKTVPKVSELSSERGANGFGSSGA